MIKITFSLLLILFLSTNIYSADGSSGCGPGWYVAKKNTILSSSLRATTNGILLPTVTLGMTFGTSNCSKHSLVRIEKQRIKYATDNYFEIAAEAAKGNGEFLVAYGELMGCNVDSLGHFSGQMKKNFSKLFPSINVKPQALLKETYNVILRDKKLITTCLQG